MGEHPSLTITAKEADKPAILTNKLTLERVPHMTLTAGANSKAIASLSGKEEFNIDTDTTHYYGRTSREASENSVGEGEIGDMWQLRTEPVMCTTTVDGNGGTTADGAASITLQLEYGEGYNLRSAGFKKQYADLIGAEGSTGNSYGTTIWSYPQLAFTLTWKDLGYPYIAFRGSGILKGEDVPADSYVAYYRNSDTLTAPKLVYQNAASYGDLVYWYTSENGTETADSRCYLPGETVQEPDDTTLLLRRSGRARSRLWRPVRPSRTGAGSNAPKAASSWFPRTAEWSKAGTPSRTEAEHVMRSEHTPS